MFNHSMSIQPKKINNLIGQLGLKQRRVAQNIGVHYTTMSRKAKDGTRYDMETLEKISKELGIKVDFLLDDSREYHEGQPIPADAILPTPKPTDTPEGDAIAAVIEIAKRQFEELKGVASRTESAKSSDQAVDILSNILEEMKNLRVNMDRVLEHLDLHGGEHDPD